LLRHTVNGLNRLPWHGSKDPINALIAQLLFDFHQKLEFGVQLHFWGQRHIL